MIKNFILINSDQQDVLKTAAFKIGFFKCLIIFLSIFGSIKVVNWIRKLCHFIQKYHNKTDKEIQNDIINKEINRAKTDLLIYIRRLYHVDIYENYF